MVKYINKNEKNEKNEKNDPLYIFKKVNIRLHYYYANRSLYDF